MGLTVLTALEIFTNPGDIEITIGQKNEEAKFAIGIFRGPGHRFKPILTTKPFAKTLEEAIETVRAILEGIRAHMMEDLTNRTCPIVEYLNPENLEIDESKVLNADLIVRILDELKERRVASTCTILATAS